ncbi:nucleoplasmin-3 [Engraulis encrasicolus]|uniref:nucleoplasmin-3 n=1 Tax=Engraulis encrasicolus TaxID=184585 RepID=UPI002FD34B2E
MMAMMADEGSDAGSMPGQSRLESYLFSCELSSEVPFYTFQADEDEDLEHFLELRTACVGEGAKDEFNVVEVTAFNYQGKKTAVPIANLHISRLPMLSLGGFELMAPVTLRLKSGTGPVTISGMHLVASEDGEESDITDDEDDLEDELEPIKPAKKKQKL